MKVIGTSSGGVIVELTNGEWEALGGGTYISGYTRHPQTTSPPDIRKTADALRSIRNAKPELQQIRTIMQTFLMLTSPEEIQKTLKECGIAEKFEEPDDENPVDFADNPAVDG